jgi:hypothetical protein
MQAMTLCEVKRCAVFLRGNGSIQRRILICSVTGTVLVQQIQIRIARNLPRDEIEHPLGTGEVSRQDKMAHEETALRDSLLIQDEIADLPVHFLDRRLVRFNIISRLGILAGGLRVSVLHIGHIDIDHSIEQGQRFRAVIASGIVDQRQVKPSLGRNVDSSDDLGDHVARANEVDVVAALVLKLEHHSRQVARFYRSAYAFLTDFPVLAKNAAKIAPAEKDRPRSIPAPEHIFFSMVRPRTVNDRTLPGPADGSFDSQ